MLTQQSQYKHDKVNRVVEINCFVFAGRFGKGDFLINISEIITDLGLFHRVRHCKFFQ